MRERRRDRGRPITATISGEVFVSANLAETIAPISATIIGRARAEWLASFLPRGTVGDPAAVGAEPKTGRIRAV
jgi:hypothetical protein